MYTIEISESPNEECIDISVFKINKYIKYIEGNINPLLHRHQWS